MTADERTDALYEILDEAVADIEAATDLNGSAAVYRAIITFALDRLPRTLCQEHLRADLTRIAGMVEREIAGLQERAH